jgi:hypothetical protein
MPPSAELCTEGINRSGAPEGSYMTCHVDPTVLHSSCLGDCGP